MGIRYVNFHVHHLALLQENSNFKVTECKCKQYFLVHAIIQAPPKEVPKTIENQRIYDETVVDPEDEEV